MERLGVHNPCLLEAHDLQTILHQQVAGCSIGSLHMWISISSKETGGKSPSSSKQVCCLVGSKIPQAFIGTCSALFFPCLDESTWKEKGIRNFCNSPKEQSLAEIVTV